MEVLRSRILFLLTILNTVYAAKVWLPNTNIDLNLNYEDRSLPCGNQRVVFPPVLDYSVRFGILMNVKGYVLPLNGALKLAKDSEIILGPDTNSTCEEKDTIFMGHSPTDWLDPDAWNSTTINKATPDAERIPCQYDDVIFPPNSQFMLLLPDVEQTVRSVKIENQNVDQLRFDQIMQAGSAYGSDAKFILNKFWDSGVAIKDNNKRCYNLKCACQENKFDINCSRKKCPKTNCLNPIRPIGNCCFICGGVLQVKLDGSNIGINELMTLTYEIIDKFGGVGQLDVHFGRLRNKILQVVVIESGEYDGTSAEIVQILKGELASQHSLYDALMLESGSPGSMERHGIKIAAVMLLAVTLVLATVILFYHPPSNYHHDGAQVFARFHNREGSTGGASTVSRENLSLTASFRNPLYYAQRDQKQSSEPVEQQSTFEPRMSDLLAQDQI